MKEQVEEQLKKEEDIQEFVFLGEGNQITWSNEHFLYPQPYKSLRYRVTFKDHKTFTYDMFIDKGGYLQIHQWT